MTVKFFLQEADLSDDEAFIARVLAVQNCFFEKGGGNELETCLTERMFSQERAGPDLDAGLLLSFDPVWKR